MTGRLVIIGSGFAGMVAAWEADRQGVRTTIISAGDAGTAMSSGSFLARSLGFSQQDSEPLTKYEQEVLKALLPEWNYLKNRGLVINVFGTISPISVAAPWHSKAVLSPDGKFPYERVLLLGFDECANFWGRFAAQTLTSIGLAGIEFIGDTLPEMLGMENPQPLQVAGWFEESSKNVETFANAVAEKAKEHKADIVLVPPVLGTTMQVAHNLEEMLSIPIAEMWAPWGSAGIRFVNLLKERILAKTNIELVEAEVIGLIRNGNRIEAVQTNNHSDITVENDDKLIIAMGGTLLAARDIGVERFRPPVDLPWQIAEDDWIITDPERLFDKEVDSYHPALSFGIEVDDRLRPKDVQGQIWAENCHLCGDVISGAYPARGGLSGAMKTAIAAVRNALDE